MGDDFALLFVCTANICRSPIAEYLGRDLLKGLVVGSAGTHAVPGQPMDPVARNMLDVPSSSGFRSRPLNRELIVYADLVLTATREHRAAVATLVPAATGRTFTLLEFAALAAIVPPPPGLDATERARALLDEVRLARGRIPPRGAAVDLADPHGGPRSGYLAVLGQVRTALSDLATHLGA